MARRVRQDSQGFSFARVDLFRWGLVRSCHFYRRISKPMRNQFEPQRPSVFLKVSVPSGHKTFEKIQFHLLAASSRSSSAIRNSDAPTTGSETDFDLLPGGLPRPRSNPAFPPACNCSRHRYKNFRRTPNSSAKAVIVLPPCPMRLTASCLNSALYLLRLPIGHLHYDR
jgi:hypothetical protein